MNLNNNNNNNNHKNINNNHNKNNNNKNQNKYLLLNPVAHYVFKKRHNIFKIIIKPFLVKKRLVKSLFKEEIKKA